MRGVVTCSGFMVAFAIVIIIHLMKEFCNVLHKEITSDGNIEVALIYADMDKGLFQIGVTEEYAHPFGGRTGKCYYEKTYSFN